MHVVRSRLPIFFHRRLLLVGAAGLALTLPLGARLAQLTVVEGPELRAQAEAATRRSRYLPTVRGAIYDRKGRVLAQDRASWSLAVPFEVIAGIWAVEQSEREARLELGDEWSLLDPDQQGEAILSRLGWWDELVETFFRQVGRSPEERERMLKERDAVHARISRMAARVTQGQRRAFELRKAADADRILGDFRPRPIAEEQSAHVLLTDLDDDRAFEVSREADRLLATASDRLGGRRVDPLLELIDRPRREHLWTDQVVPVPIDRSTLPRDLRTPDIIEIEVEGVADHLVGSVRAVQKEDLERRPFDGGADLGGYRSGTGQIGSQMVGSRGLEAAWESQLRGNLGVKSANLETDEVEVEPAVPGRDLHLTLDVALQARIQALLDPRIGLTRVQQYHYGWKGTDPVPTTLPLGTPLDASVVVLDIDTGELLALCSNPSFTDGISMSTGERATRAPFVNRVIESSYPPGSLIKPLLYGAAVTEGKVGIEEEIECTGHYYPEHTDRFRCWIYRDYYGFATHGPLDIGDALMRSCNIYFYDLADRLGNEGMVRWLKQFGLDDPLRVGLLHERAGRWRGETGGNVPDRASSLPQLGIGQGELLWSPVQAANAYATFARGGVIRDARLVADESLLTDRREGDLELDPRAVTAALEGMRRVVEERDGTGGAIRYESGYREPIFDIPGIQVWGKTGTAQSPPRRIDVDGDGAFGGPDDKTVRGLAHAWYAALVGLETEGRPRYVIITLVEHGESGGRASGPIVAAVIRALQAEGYLEADRPGAGS